MKKWLLEISVSLILCLCLCVCGVYAESTTDEVFSAIQAGYGTLNLQGSQGIQFPVNEGQIGFLQTDMTTEVETLVRPFIFAQTPGVYRNEERSRQALERVFLTAASLITELESYSTSEKEISLFNAARIENAAIDVTFVNYGYAAQHDGKWDLQYIGLRDKESGQAIHDEIYVFCRFSVLRNDGLESIMNVLITDQNAVWQIAAAMKKKGNVPDQVERWYSERMGIKTESQHDEEKQERMQIRIRESGNVNVRRKADADSGRVGMAQAGHVYVCLSIAENGWYEIVLEDGKTGFVSSKMATMIN